MDELIKFIESQNFNVIDQTGNFDAAVDCESFHSSFYDNKGRTQYQGSGRYLFSEIFRLIKKEISNRLYLGLTGFDFLFVLPDGNFATIKARIGA